MSRAQAYFFVVQTCCGKVESQFSAYLPKIEKKSFFLDDDDNGDDDDDNDDDDDDDTGNNDNQKRIGTGLKSIFPVSGRFFHRSRNSGMIVKKATFSPVRFRPNRPGRFPGLGSWDKILTKKANPGIKTRRKSVLLYIGKN